MKYQDFFAKAKEKNITNIQITEKETIDSSVEIINGKLESFDDYDNTDYNIKAEYNNKTVKISCNYLAEDIIDLIILKVEATDTFYEDEYLEKKDIIKKNNKQNIDISNEVKILKNLDKLREKYPVVDKLTTYFSETYTNTRIINNKGVDISTDSHLSSLLVEAIINNNGDVTSFDRKILTTNKNEIDFISFTEDVMKKTILQSAREKLETKKYNIILDSYAASNIIAHLISMLSATSIRNKVSCLEKKLNKEVFNKSLNIIEDPTNKEYPGYRLFDDEGTNTYKKYLIEKGKIKNYLYNVKEAKIKKVASTGNGYNGIDTRNMYVNPGDKNQEELFASIKDGIYITDYMGSMGTSISTVNGQISLQVFGFIIKDGKLSSGFEPSIMTTTIFELLTNIEEIGSDLQFTNTSSASPSLYIKNISIAR